MRNFQGRKTFKARYPGTCVVNNDEIVEGQTITEHDGGGYRHEFCLPKPPAKEGQEDCPVCFTKKSLTGGCLCD